MSNGITPTWRNRLRATYTAARGRPVAYRLTIEGGTLYFGPGTKSAFVGECLFDGKGRVVSTDAKGNTYEV